MKSIAKIDIEPTEMISEGSWGSRDLGSHASTMELFKSDTPNHYVIEWDIDTLDTTEHIGLWFDGKELIDYDGVFSLPAEAIEFLEKQGFDCSYAKE